MEIETRILNLTQHQATADQLAAGVIDLLPAAREELQALLMFSTLPNKADVLARATAIAALADFQVDEMTFPPLDSLEAMIGGALWLMVPLADALRGVDIEPVFAFSVRDTEEQRQEDGSVRKVAVFRHGGFVPVPETDGFF